MSRQPKRLVRGMNGTDLCSCSSRWTNRQADSPVRLTSDCCDIVCHTGLQKCTEGNREGKQPLIAEIKLVLTSWPF